MKIAEKFLPFFIVANLLVGCSDKFRVSGKFMSVIPKTSSFDQPPGPFVSSPQSIDYNIESPQAQISASGEVTLQVGESKNLTFYGDKECALALAATPPTNGQIVISGLNLFSSLSLFVQDSARSSECIDTHIEIGAYQIPLNVTGVYSNAPNWNDYIRYSDSSAAHYQQPNVACDGSEIGSRLPCIHGAQFKQVSVPELSSCQDLELNDSLGLFRWVCEVVNGAPVFYNLEFITGKSLKDMVTASGWKDIQVQLIKGDETIGQSVSRPWWNNPVKPLPENKDAGVSALKNATSGNGEIFVLDKTIETDGYSLEDDKISLVVLGAHRLTYSSTAAQNCQLASGERASADTHCLLFAGSQKFLWIEGNFQGHKLAAGTQQGLLLVDSDFSRIENSLFLNHKNANLYLLRSHYNRVRQSSFSNSGIGIYTSNSSFNRFENTHVINNAEEGFAIRGTWMGNHVDQVGKFNIIVDSNISNNSGSGHYSTCGTGNSLLSGNLIAFNGADGFSMACSGASINSHGTYAKNGRHGLRTDDNTNHYHRINNIFSYANGQRGMNFELYTSSTQAANVVAIENQNAGVHSVGSVHFSDHILVGNNGKDCESNNTSGNGIVDTTCTDTGINGSSTYTGMSSTAVLRNGRNDIEAFAGLVSGDESANASDIDGVQDYSNIDDFTHFENRFRTWGHLANHGRCSAGNCYVWDFSLHSDDLQYSRTIGDGENQNAETFSPATPCPSYVDGNQAMSTLNWKYEITGGDLDGLCETGETCSSETTFLKNAREILGDQYGNDDGLCESNEACYLAPNFGAYQGKGDLYSRGTCQFSNGPVSNVKMYAHPTVP